MVANTSNSYSSSNWRIDSNWWWLCYCTFHLYLILKHMKKETNAQSILAIVVGFLVLYWIFDKQWLLYISLGVGILGLLSSAFAALVTKGWMKFAEILGRINASILLTLIFFIFLTPIALLMKLISGADHLKLKSPGDTVYEERNYTYKAKDLKNIW